MIIDTPGQRREYGAGRNRERRSYPFQQEAEQDIKQGTHTRSYVAPLLYNHTISLIGLISALVLPTLLQDITNKADKWGDSGRIDPFTDVYNVSRFGVYVLGSVPSLSFSARFLHDRPSYRLSRPCGQRA